MSIYEDFTKVSKKNIGKLRRARSLLDENFGITYISYFTISPNGYGSLLSSNMEFVDHYIENKLYFSDRLLVHPKNLREGVILWSSLGKDYEKVHDPDRFNMDHGITLFKKSIVPGFSYEGFGFATFLGNTNALNIYLNELDTLKLFCNFMKMEMSPVFKEVHSNPFDIGTLKGNSFHEPLPAQSPFSNQEKPRINLLLEKSETS